MKYFVTLLIVTSFILLSCGGNKEGKSPEMTAQEKSELFTKAKAIFGALPDKMPGSENDTPDLIALGKKLYNEKKLSLDGNESCNTCHDIEKLAGDDGKSVSDGSVEGKKGTRNANTVLNAGYQFVQFWDGREKDLIGQAKGPMLNPLEMAMPDAKSVEKAISAIPEYKELFTKAFPSVASPITFDNIAIAIAAFERTLISKSRYDMYLAGNPKAMTNDELQGMKLFIETGCITCHTGPLVGGNMYQKMGLVHPYENTKDMGRYDVTKLEPDKFMFKVAMLRNAFLTAPYFHDGSVVKLEDALKKMAWLNLGKELKPEEIDLIVGFIKALSDTEKEKSLAIK